MELVLVPLGIVFFLMAGGALAGVVFRIVWFVLKLVFVVLFWWLILLIGGATLLRAIFS